MTKLIVTLVLLLIIGRMVWRFMYAIFEGAGMLKEPHDRERKAVKLARDPVCGTYVAAVSGLSVSAKGQTHYFCSKECRDKYRAA